MEDEFTIAIRGFLTVHKSLVYAVYASVQDEAVQLVRDGIAAGIFNDMGSGSNVDVCIITKDGAKYIRPYDEANVKSQRTCLQDNPFPRQYFKRLRRQRLLPTGRDLHCLAGSYIETAHDAY
ncbi:unnamed protein product [Trichobilharzia szidati]|nr:unnamed protein product [Trichobilharzia szidati]